MMFGNIMYLRPGNLWKSFRVLKMHVDNVDGYAKNSYEDSLVRSIPISSAAPSLLLRRSFDFAASYRAWQNILAAAFVANFDIFLSFYKLYNQVMVIKLCTLYRYPEPC